MNTVTLVIIFILILLAVLLFAEMKKSKTDQIKNDIPTEQPSANEANATSTRRLRAQEALSSNEKNNNESSSLKIDDESPLPDPFKH